MSDVAVKIKKGTEIELNPEELRKLHEAMSAPGKRKRVIRKVVLISANIVVALLILLPLLYAVSIAFMPSSDLYTMGMNLIPTHPTLDNFKEALTKVPLIRFVVNSFLVAGLITVGQVISCSLAAFSFSFLDFKGKNVLFMLVMATMMIPGEATMLDGCSNIRFILTILMPLTKSGIGAMVVYTFINAWNMYMWPLLVNGSNEMRTVQIGISMLNSIDAQSITMMIAGVVMIIIPSISIFIIGQKQLIRGMFSGAVKG